MEEYKDLVEESLENMQDMKIKAQQDLESDVEDVNAKESNGQDKKDKTSAPDSQTNLGGKEEKESGEGQEAGKEEEAKEDECQVQDKKLAQKVEELNDRLLRQMAEFDNYRKRTTKEKSEMYDMGVKDFVEKLLPVVDNLERALQSVQTKDTFTEGVDMIYKQLQKTLEESHIKAIEAVGCPFNPELHNAVMHEEDESKAANQVVEEFQKGYTYKDKVVRHSMVKVVN